MSECTHDCSSCGVDCDSRQMDPQDFLEKLSAGSSVKKVIGVVSGKGGVGKYGHLPACLCFYEGRIQDSNS